MRRYLLALFLLVSLYTTYCQKLGGYSFLRVPHSVNYYFKESSAAYSQSISVGAGIYHGPKFLELATFITTSNTYGYYTFFGKVLNNNQYNDYFNVSTSWFGEVAMVPIQEENITSIWAFSSGVSVVPNVRFQKFNLGVPLNLGISYSDGYFSLLSRFVINFSLAIR